MSFKERRKEIETAMFDMLQLRLPDVQWSKRYKGFQRGKGLVGSLVGDRTDFEYDAKNKREATGRYVIIITDSEHLDTVDDIADEVFELLDNDDLNGTATVCDVKRISLASAPTKEDAGAAILELVVKYYV